MEKTRGLCQTETRMEVQRGLPRDGRLGRLRLADEVDGHRDGQVDRHVVQQPRRVLPLANQGDRRARQLRLHRRELLSEGQLARLLRLDRIELRKVLDAADNDGNDTDGLPKLPR